MTQKKRPSASSLVLASACAFALLGLVGCSPHLAGTHDAALEYAIDAEPATGKVLDTEAAAARTKARLSAAQITADVDESGDHRRVRIVVDADAAAAVDSLLLWRGGLSAYRAEQWHPDSLDAKALAELPVASVEPDQRGRALALTFPVGARDGIAAERAANPSARVALVRGRTLLALLPIDEALATPLVLRFGDDVTAYAHAAYARELLASPMLPPMHRVSLESLPPDRGLAAACAVLPFVLSFGWLLFVRRFDRARPEPTWLVVATFALGGLSVVPAAIAELACGAATPWLDPSVMTLGGQLWALPIAITVFSLVVGVAEEGSKFLGAWSLARHRREFDEPVDGIVYGCASALGFAAVENVKYFAVGRMSGVVIAVRAFMTVPAHMFFGAIWGYALGRKLVSGKTSVFGFFLLAALAHGTFDALLSTDGVQLAAAALMLGLAFGFVALLRSALRHGAVSPSRAHADSTAAPPTEMLPSGELPRVYFRVGSPGAFYACATGIIACSFSLTVLGGAYELLHHRIGLVFVTMATAILSLFGASAYGASETIPLDVAVDAQGVTLGGARTPWRLVVSLNIEVVGKRACVVLQTTESAVRLGPATVATADAIARAIRAVHASV
jgi:RsiW-degrading membrane proteinase PrsW (M82 family)